MDHSILEQCPEQVKEQLVYRRYKPGDILLLQGEREEYAHLLLEGSVRVFKLLPDGSCSQIDYFEAVQFIGNIELFARVPTMNMVEAATPCFTACIPLAAFYSWVESDAALCRTLLEDMAVQIVAFNRQIMLGKSLPRQEHFWLLLLEADRSGKPMTRQILQDCMSVSSRTINRLIQQASEKGLIKVEDGVITLCDRDRIAKQYLKTPDPI